MGLVVRCPLRPPNYQLGLVDPRLDQKVQRVLSHQRMVLQSVKVVLRWRYQVPMRVVPAVVGPKLPGLLLVPVLPTRLPLAVVERPKGWRVAAVEHPREKQRVVVAVVERPRGWQQVAAVGHPREFLLRTVERPKG
jgi:hypothetical protein